MRLPLIIFVWILALSAAALGQICQENEQRPCRYPLIGECRPGVQICENGQWGVCFGGVGPSEEVCNDGKDNDCDDQIDEECECRNGETRICGPETDVGICSFGRQTCTSSGWGTCVNATYAFPNELCGDNGAGNRLDDNCNEQADEGCVVSINETRSDCSNGIKDGNEDGVDCGGSCRRCATCDDGIQNQNETGIDCGGTCRPCASCSDGIKNQNETGIDCGGVCEPCIRLEDTDADNDGVAYSAELLKGTDPDDEDTDGDGIDDKKDKMPLCANAFCDEAYGETSKNCKEDCRKDNKIAVIVVIGVVVILFILAIFFYKRMSSAPSKNKSTGAKVVPKIDVERYGALEKEMTKDKKSAVEDKLDKSLKKADSFLKR